MAVTLTDLPKPAELEPPYLPLGQGHRAADWLTEEEVAADQRRRLYGAMIELVAEHGYTAVGIRELAGLAHTSLQAIYKCWGSKENYFLATYDMIVTRAIERVASAYASQQDWQQRLRCAFGALAAEVVEQPQAALLALSEVLGAGPAGLARLDETRSVFEAMVGAGFAEAPDGPLPPIIVKGIVRGVERIIRQRLLAGREHELPELTEQLLAWALSYHSPAAAELATKAPQPAPPARNPLRQDPRDVRVYLLRIAAETAATGGWTQLTSGRIAINADISARQVRELCGDDPRKCFVDALGLLSAEALICARHAARQSHDRLAGLHLGIQALVQRLERDRTLCQLAFVEIFALGPSAIKDREALLSTFTKTLSNALPADARPAPLHAEASIGAMWGVIHHHVTHAQTSQLPALAGELSYLALAPAVGAQQAIRTINSARHDPAMRQHRATSRQPSGTYRNGHDGRLAAPTNPRQPTAKAAPRCPRSTRTPENQGKS
ncbi:MAG: TetR/AcrR family transcriptional regulator [Solirubrobacteraceae bacterium]